MFMTYKMASAQMNVPDGGAAGPLGGGSWLKFVTGGNTASIIENNGLNLLGGATQPVRIRNASLLVGYVNLGGNYGAGNALISGNMGIGNDNPLSPLDVNGNLTLRNSLNTLGAGARINFTGFGRDFPGPSIRSYLDYAGAHNYSRLVLSSYYDGNKDEITLVNGTIGIGTADPRGYKLAVNGSIHAKEVKVDLISWPDYVFTPAFVLTPLTEVKAYINRNHRLPDMPSEQEVKESGLNLGEMNVKLLKKIEELTLYLIDLKTQNETLKERVKLIEDIHKNEINSR
ncbi:hypothetical protein [Arcticibacter eurypsychrophilus]|uniref:hypothetical protein n=1 Tax=Arcticibacter eurypsychrophilus TaxID=1434752 RepID=UPI00147EC697|nr:hypothetical protein [Arcticibacter eurypsychrophilus]